MKRRMSFMKLKIKFILFLSSYFPLFLILMVKNWFNLWFTLIVLAIGVLCVLTWIIVFHMAKRRTAEKYVVLRTENRTKDSLNYIIPYIISFMNIDLRQWQDLTGLTILLLILFAVYVNSNLIYINPVFSIFKYKIYYAEVKKPYMKSMQQEVMVITKNNRLPKSREITLKEIDKEVFMEVIKR